MRSIWKYELDLKDEQSVPMPKRAQILCVQVQGGMPCVWVYVESSEPLIWVRIWCKGTGHDLTEMDASARYIGTTQHAAGQLVFHWFEVSRGPMVEGD